MHLRGKTIFITGGSRGIGRAIALKAAADGANVVIAAKTNEPHPKLPGTIQTVAREIEAIGGKALPLQLDVRRDDDIRVTVAAVAPATDQIAGRCLGHVLVNGPTTPAIGAARIGGCSMHYRRVAFRLRVRSNTASFA